MGCPSIGVSFRPQPKPEDSSPLLILHKLWKGDPSLIQAHEDLSLLQCKYGLPIPLTHTTLNSISFLVVRVSPPSYEMYLNDERILLVLGIRKEQQEWSSR